MNKSRLEAFTDAIIAIIMTILVLELEAPAEATFAAFWALRYRFLIYLVSFLSLAVYWNNHHHLLQASSKISGGVLWCNILFILCLSFFPFASAWVDEHLFSLVPEIAYGLLVLITNLSYALLSKALVKVNGPNSIVAKALKHSKKQAITLILNLLGIALGFALPIAVIIMYALSMLLWIVPERRIESSFSKE